MADERCLQDGERLGNGVALPSNGTDRHPHWGDYGYKEEPKGQEVMVLAKERGGGGVEGAGVDSGISSAMDVSSGGGGKRMLWQRGKTNDDHNRSDLLDEQEEQEEVEEMIPADPMLAETHYSQYNDFETDEESADDQPEDPEEVGVATSNWPEPATSS